MNATQAARWVKVTGDGKGVAGHAGALLVAELADRVGLTAGLSAAMAHTRRRRSAHDPGVVLTHLAVSLADGGDCLADVAVLRNQPDLFGDVASDPTVFRVVDSVHANGLRNIAAARAKARARAWAAGAAPGEIVIDIDGTLVDVHSDKQDATRPTSVGSGSTRSSPTSTRPAKRSPVCCEPAGPGRTTPPIISRPSTVRWPSSR